MPRLFYKDLKAHESAYKHARADEAANDLILGAKVNAYTGIEDAKNKAVDEIATNYGKFLKALKTKEIPLLNKATVAEKQLEQVAQASDSTSMLNMLMPASQRKTGSLSEPSSSVIAGLNANYTPEQQKIVNAYNASHNSTNVPTVLKTVKQALGGSNDIMVKDFEKILHANGYRASANKSKTGTLQSPNINAIQTVISAMQEQYFKPVQ